VPQPRAVLCKIQRGGYADERIALPAYRAAAPLRGGPLPSSWGHLPYFNSRAYLQQLSKYACDLPSQSALMVRGPKSTGKSLGLQAMAQLWQKQGRVVIDVDLKGLVGGYDRFIHYFWHRVLHALWGLNLTPDELRTC